MILDRDGTIIVERHYLSDPGQVELIPGVAGGLRKLSQMGLGLVVITNQSGVGRGLLDDNRLDLIHRRLHELLAVEGIRLDGIYSCPHTPEDDCLCRKPRPGLMAAASKELVFDPRASFVIGDKPCDIELGRQVGATTFLVRTGYGAQVAQEGIIMTDYVVDDLLEAAGVIKGLVISAGEHAMPIDPEHRERIKTHLRGSAEVKRRVAEECLESIIAAAGLITKTLSKDGKVLLCGNGGSAADCQHMAAEFVNRLTKDFQRPGLPAIALTTDTSFLTAYGNDYEFGGIFERQVKTLGKAGDILIGISTSGNSTNVIRAVEEAKKANIGTVVLMGTTGLLAEVADIAILVPSANTQYIQEAHLTIEHILCDLVERSVFEDQEKGQQ